MGYTTGSCATAVATATTKMLLTQKQIDYIKIKLPNNEECIFKIEDVYMSKEKVTCSVKKDSGDDPDVTDGIKIFATATFRENEKISQTSIHPTPIIFLNSLNEVKLEISAGIGIGVVTSEGLQCKVFEPAINPVPRKMIKENVLNICKIQKCNKPIKIKLYVPDGELVAKKTFNERLGIVGGISILGTTGIVEPMSEKALVDTIKILIDKQKLVDSNKILISLGNYGKDYCKNILNINMDNGIKISNYIGETLDYLVYKQYKKVLLVGHVGKLIKVAGAIMNTHSSNADCRMEILAVHAAIAGADTCIVNNIMNCLTTDSAIDILEKNNLEKMVFKKIMEKIKFHINYRVKSEIQVEVLIFSKQDKLISKSEYADDFIKMFLEV